MIFHDYGLSALCFLSVLWHWRLVRDRKGIRPVIIQCHIRYPQRLSSGTDGGRESRNRPPRITWKNRNQNVDGGGVKVMLMMVLLRCSSEAYISSAVTANVRRRYCCHELFGFDILLDDRLKPWVLEANISPRYRHCSTATLQFETNYSAEFDSVPKHDFGESKCKSVGFSQHRFLLDV